MFFFKFKKTSVILWLQILIGVGGNKHSVIRENVYAGDPPGSQTVGILSPGEFRGFWIKSSGGLTAAGRENEVRQENCTTVVVRSLNRQKTIASEPFSVGRSDARCFMTM